MVEPLTVGVHACKLANLKFGENVVVFGAGPVGLLTAAVAKTIGAKNIMVVDIFDNKLQMAKIWVLPPTPSTSRPATIW